MKRSILSLAVLGVLAGGCHTSIAFDGGTPIAIQGEGPKPKPKIRPASSKAVLREAKIEITEMVQFELNSSVIRAESFGLLDDVAKVLKDHPEVKKIAIEGHASADGDDNQNLLLSDARAKSVMAYLVAKGGIDQKRMTAQGFGEKKPIADNNTEEGRVKNRRVEFNVVERDPNMIDKAAKEKK